MAVWRKLLVQVLSGLFGLGSWIAMTGLWVELPVLVQRLPERWALACQLAFFLQLANIGPIAYGIFHYLWPKQVTERCATHWQLGLGAISTLLLIFLWKETVSDVSVAFFALSFGLSLVDCTSSVVFLPYMAYFRPCYLTPYLIGEGLSGLLPSLLAIAQGIENPECFNQTVFSTETNTTEFILIPKIIEPRFEPEWFFAFLLVMVLISWIAFVLLDKLPACKKEMVKYYSNDGANAENFEMEEKVQTEAQVPERPSYVLYMYLLFLQGWASIATFGVFPAIQPYSCLPYGEQPFHLAVTLCGIAYPVACLLAMFWELKSTFWISILSAVATLVSLYALATALLSPNPPLADTTEGAYLIVICWVFFMGTFSYIKTVVTILLGKFWGHNALFWCGAVTQAGAMIGTLLMFVLVNIFHVFKDEGICMI